MKAKFGDITSENGFWLGLQELSNDVEEENLDEVYSKLEPMNKARILYPDNSEDSLRGDISESYGEELIKRADDLERVEHYVYAERDDEITVFAEEKNEPLLLLYAQRTFHYRFLDSLRKMVDDYLNS